MTENQETSPATPRHGWLLYDGQCRFCTNLARKFNPWLEEQGFRPVPLQTPWVRNELNLSGDEVPAEMVLLRRDESRFDGADAALHLARQHKLLRPIARLARWALIHRLLTVVYRFIAARRSRLAPWIRPREIEDRPVV